MSKYSHLSDRELLIGNRIKLEGIEERLDRRDTLCRTQSDRLAKIEARSGLFGMIGGFFGGLVGYVARGGS